MFSVAGGGCAEGGRKLVGYDVAAARPKMRDEPCWDPAARRADGWGFAGACRALRFASVNRRVGCPRAKTAASV